MLIRNNASSNRLLPVAISVMVGFLVSAQARATILLPHSGPTVTPGTASFAGLTAVAGADETIPFTGLDIFNAVKFAGTLESKVYREASGTLDFAYQVNADATGPDSIHGVSVSSYSNFSTDVDWIAGTGAVTYGSADRLAAGNGDTVSFDYSAGANAIAPGDSADWILIKTNAVFFNNLGNTSLIDGGTANLQTFQPVPEPASIGLLVLGAGMLLPRRSRRRT
jgi:hypothetical protein